MEYQFLEFEVEDGLGILTMNRPPGNAISVELTEEFQNMCREIEEGREARCLILMSALPKYFMVGADLKTMPTDIDFGDLDFSQPPEQIVAATFKKIAPHVVKMLHGGQAMMNAVEALPIPTIAAIGGHAMGGGLELALACDFRIMARGQPNVALTETTLGIIPAAGGTQRLPRVVGRAKALEMILLGKRIDADEAEAIGLVTKAVDADRLEEEARELGRVLARGATVAKGCAKKCVIKSQELSLEEGLALERECMARLTETKDMLEGIMAFTQGREPNYLGE